MSEPLLSNADLKNIFQAAVSMSAKSAGKKAPLEVEEKLRINNELKDKLRKSKAETVYVTNRKEREKVLRTLNSDFMNLRSGLSANPRAISHASSLVRYAEKYTRISRFVEIVFRSAASAMTASKDTTISAEMLRQANLLVKKDLGVNESILVEADVYDALTPAQLTSKITKLNTEWLKAGKHTVGEFADFMVSKGFDENDIIHAFQIKMKIDIEDKDMNIDVSTVDKLPPNKKTLFLQLITVLRKMSQEERESLARELKKELKTSGLGESLLEAPLSGLRKELARGIDTIRNYKKTLRPRPANFFKKGSRPAYSYDELVSSWKTSGKKPEYKEVVAFLGDSGFTSKEIRDIFTKAKVQTGLRSDRVVKLVDLIVKAELVPFTLKVLKDDFKIVESIQALYESIDDAITPGQAAEMIKFIISRGFKKSAESRTAVVNLVE